MTIAKISAPIVCFSGNWNQNFYSSCPSNYRVVDIDIHRRKCFYFLDGIMKEETMCQMEQVGQYTDSRIVYYRELE